MRSDVYGFRVSQRLREVEVDAEVAAGTAQSDAKYSSFELAYEVMFDGDETAEVRNGELFVTRLSAGLSIVVHVTNVTANFELSLHGVSTACSLGLAESSVHFIGQGLPDSVDWASGRPSVRVLNEEGGVEKLLTWVNGVKEQMADADIATYTLEDSLETLPGPSDDRVIQALSTAYALNNIARRELLSDALEALPDKLDSETVSEVYWQQLGGLVQSKPTHAQSRNAKKILGG